MPIIVIITAEHINHSRRVARKEIAAWLWGVRASRRHGLHRQADFLERHAAEYKAWAGARPVPV